MRVNVGSGAQLSDSRQWGLTTPDGSVRDVTFSIFKLSSGEHPGKAIYLLFSPHSAESFMSTHVQLPSKRGELVMLEETR